MKFFEKEWKGRLYRFYAQREGDKLWIHFKGRSWLWKKKQQNQKSPPPAGFPKSSHIILQNKGQSQQEASLETPPTKKPETIIKASLPGKIQKIFVEKSSPIKKGQDLLLLSSMKIEYHFMAEADGHVEELFCKEGDIVNEGQALLKIKYN